MQQNPYDCFEVIGMQEGVTVINIMRDGTVCEDISTYLKSPDQLPGTTKRLLQMFIRRGEKIETEKECG